MISELRQGLLRDQFAGEFSCGLVSVFNRKRAGFDLLFAEVTRIAGWQSCQSERQRQQVEKLPVTSLYLLCVLCFGFRHLDHFTLERKGPEKRNSMTVSDAFSFC